MGWIGVDFDKTLTVTDPNQKWDDSDGDIIQKDIPLMIERVKAWLEDGVDVRMLTARAAHPTKKHKNGVPKKHKKSIEKLKKWSVEKFGQEIPIQFWKDRDMEQLWDDKAKQVFPNTGIAVEDYAWRDKK